MPSRTTIPSQSGYRALIAGPPASLLPLWLRRFLGQPQQFTDLAQRRTRRDLRLVQAEQDRHFRSQERQTCQRGHLLRGERSQRAEPLSRPPRHLGQKLKPALYLGRYRLSDLPVRPSRRRHFHQYPYITRLEVLVEEVTSLLPLLPQRQVGLVHGRLPGKPLPVLHVQHREHQVLPRSEVVVNLAQRHPRRLGDTPRRQARV